MAESHSLGGIPYVSSHVSLGPCVTNLLVESLLHDPATYSTYPARWHNLLRHLSLSHTLVVLYLRNLPQSCYPNHSLLPFEDDGLNQTALPFSPSSASLSSMGQPRSRVGSTVGSETGSVAASRPPRRERVVEIVMPEPLAAKPHHEIASPDVPSKPVRRRGSISSLASVTSFSFGRRRSNSLATDLRSQQGIGNFVSVAEPAASLAPGKAGLPPVSYPSAKRYGFRNASDVPGRRRNPSESRPGSLFSFQTGASTTSYMPRASHIGESRHSGLAESSWPLQAPPPIGVRPRSSFGSVTSSRQSDLGSPVPGRKPGPTVFQRCEPAFDKPMPYIPGRAPVLRVFVPLSERVQRWPSAEGAAAAIEELEKCGALKRMRLGDLIVSRSCIGPELTKDQHRNSCAKDHRARVVVCTLCQTYACAASIQIHPDRSPALLCRLFRSAPFLLLPFPSGTSDNPPEPRSVSRSRP